ncbi:aminoglycoside 3'-phosphotransferase [Micrococcales bacterium 31B]|nr:aminoglycoside 3'-phosphotransferase [Micrococcales bacterium 31B]
MFSPDSTLLLPSLIIGAYIGRSGLSCSRGLPGPVARRVAPGHPIRHDEGVSIPPSALAPPDRVLALAGGEGLECVWENNLGGLTFRTVPRVGPRGVRPPNATDTTGSRYIKFGPRHLETSFAAEAGRLAWAAPFVTVPRVLEHGGDETHEWMVTAGIPGSSAVEPLWVARPAEAVRALGAGLRALHDSLPVAECPFSWSVADRIAGAVARGLSVPTALLTPPPIDRLVVCHGDACAPNTLLDEAGRACGYVDFGALGVADRWADIAVMALSTEWNYGEGWQRPLVESYGLPWDAERMAFYQQLWNAL